MKKCTTLFVLMLLFIPKINSKMNCNTSFFKNIQVEKTNQTNKQMKVKHVLDGFFNPPLDLIQETLDLEVEPLKIETINWAEFPYKPEVSVQIAYNSEELFLQFKVNEKSVKAEITTANAKVWTDSCVELFLSPEANDEYYNLEINCIGTVLLGFRKFGESSVHASNEIIDNIRRVSSLGIRQFKERKEQPEWQITIAVPWNTFFEHKIEAFSGKKMKGNFYKCGDGLSVPHFVSWTKIKTEKPSFHQPTFFGGLELE